jgi:hypothetical protein
LGFLTVKPKIVANFETITDHQWSVMSFLGVPFSPFRMGFGYRA